MKHVTTLVLAAALTSLLSACSSTQPLTVFSKPVERLPLEAPFPEPVTMDSVRWIVVTPDNAEEVFAEMISRRQHTVVIGLSAKDYEHLSINLEKMQGHLLMLRKTLETYKDYYEPKK
jgi:hypothetical protein